jgi:NAD(P)-dependent dehydrogenase (short-subunit alcohol dehydrogenase family)
MVMPRPIRPSFIESIHHDIYDAIDPRTTLANKAHGKTILITGAGRGIGRSIAIAFAHAGADRLILTARTATQLDAVANEIKGVSNEVEVIRIPTDVTNESEVNALFSAIQGKVDILVNNAGTAESYRPLVEADTTEWWYTWEVNIKGTYLPTTYFLKKYGSIGTIINTSSMGSIGTTPGFSAYQSGKTAINRITDFIHAEYPNVRAFAYHPGGVKTELARKVPENMQKFFIDAPELAAGYCVWLTTEQADFLRGRYSDCTWDVNELMKNAQLIVEKDLLKQEIKMG